MLYKASPLLRTSSKLFTKQTRILTTGIYRKSLMPPKMMLSVPPKLRKFHLWDLTESFGVAASLSLKELTHKYFQNPSPQSQLLKIIGAPENLLQLQPGWALSFDEFRSSTLNYPTIHEFEQKIYYPLCKILHNKIKENTSTIARSNSIIIAGSLPLCLSPISDFKALSRSADLEISNIIRAHQILYKKKHPYTNMPLVHIIHASIVIAYDEFGTLKSTHYVLKNNISPIDFEFGVTPDASDCYPYIPLDQKWCAEFGDRGIPKSITDSLRPEFARLVHGRQKAFSPGSPFFLTPIGIPMSLFICLDCVRSPRNIQSIKTPLEVVLGMGAPTDEADTSILQNDGVLIVFDKSPTPLPNGSLETRKKTSQGSLENLSLLETGSFEVADLETETAKNMFSIKRSYERDQYTTLTTDLFIHPQ